MFGDFLNNIFSTHFGLASLVAIALFVIVALGGWKLRGISDSLKGHPCKAHGDELGKHSESIALIRSTLDRIEGQVGVVLQIMTANQTPRDMVAAVTYSEKHSPRRLNANGDALLADINGLEFLQANKSTLLDDIEKFVPKTSLDVENVALSVLRLRMSDDIFNEIKSWVYNAPARNIVGKDGKQKMTEVSLEDVLFVLSLPLRDMFLAEHPEIQ